MTEAQKVLFDAAAYLKYSGENRQELPTGVWQYAQVENDCQFRSGAGVSNLAFLCETLAQEAQRFLNQDTIGRYGLLFQLELRHKIGQQ